MKIFIIILVILSSTLSALTIFTPKAPPAIPLIKTLTKDSKLKVEYYQDLMIEVIPKILRNEEYIYIMPTNVAAKLYNKGKDLSLLGVTSSGLLYLISSDTTPLDIKDLNNKEIYIGAPGSSPDVISRALFAQKKVNPKIEYLSSQEIAKMIIREKIKFAVLPEPLASFALTKNKNLSRSLDFKKEWGGDTGIPQVGIFVSKKFYELNKAEIEKFLSSYKESVSWSNLNPDSAAILGKKEMNFKFPTKVLSKSIPKMNLILKRTSESKNDLKKYFSRLLKINRKTVGGKIPDDNFYIK